MSLFLRLAQSASIEEVLEDLAEIAAEKGIHLFHSVTGGVFRSVDMVIPRLLELRQRNEKKLAEGTLKM